MTGILRGFDPFMNLVVDDAVEETKTGEKISIGMVVSALTFLIFMLFFFILIQIALKFREETLLAKHLG